MYRFHWNQAKMRERSVHPEMKAMVVGRKLSETRDSIALVLVPWLHLSGWWDWHWSLALWPSRWRSTVGPPPMTKASSSAEGSSGSRGRQGLRKNRCVITGLMRRTTLETSSSQWVLSTQTPPAWVARRLSFMGKQSRQFSFKWQKTFCNLLRKSSAVGNERGVIPKFLNF